MKSLKERILELKKRKMRLFWRITHQEADIQDVADYVGDSLGLSQEAMKVDADIILFCGCTFHGRNGQNIEPVQKSNPSRFESGLFPRRILSSGRVQEIYRSTS